ncbi:MAG: menaquinone biosynthesis protein [Planctomycetes bacterium]|nr:menaquinone biosynthesis protein [Planctomycetota bacterium]
MVQMQLRKLRLGVVNFLNATPLIDGIASIKGVQLLPKFPSELIECLESKEVDFALASTIDYQRSKEQLRILPVGVLSSDGETLTVRLCSKKPFEHIKEVHCDIDSHTSIALMQIIVRNKFGIAPKIVPCDIRALSANAEDWPDTMLMIGDKVVTSATGNTFTYALDLGYEWKEQTGLPFVFATWFGTSDLDSEIVQMARMVLDRQRRCNTNRIEQVVSAHAQVRGWEVDTAHRYLTEHIQYTFTDIHKEALELFYALAHSVGSIEEVRPLRFFGA